MNGLYRLAMRRAAVVIFQNPDDRRYFISRRLVEPEKTVIISGSGVDTLAFRPVERSGRPVVTVSMVARLVRAKGVEEYVEAARRVRQALGKSIRFRLVGGPDPGNPGSMTAEWSEGVRTAGDVEILGERDDIAAILAQSDIYCLPSHGEGMPMSVLEALASGLPVVTTEVPGCRETVEDGVNGFLVPVRNVPRLADALQRLANDSGLRASFGSASRRAAESRFAVGDIVNAHLELYERVLAG
jgi:glycosyltransferase involved in cell wall biosynthesis